MEYVIISDVPTDGVSKVTEALKAPFWHFWHLITLGFLRKSVTATTGEAERIGPGAASSCEDELSKLHNQQGAKSFLNTLLVLLALPHLQKSRRTLGVRECEVDLGGDSAFLKPRVCAKSPFVTCSTAAYKGAQVDAALQDVVSSCAALALIFVSAFAGSSSSRLRSGAPHAYPEA